MNLLRNLQQFGLNPKHWQVRLKESKGPGPIKAILINREDPDIQLQGDCLIKRIEDSTVLHWLRLSLA